MGPFPLIWIWIILIVNLVIAVLNLVMGPSLSSDIHLPTNLLYCLTVLELLVCVSAAALLKFKAWGMWGYTIIGLIILIINISYHWWTLTSLIVYLVGLVVLYWSLNVGGENKAWKYLK